MNLEGHHCPDFERQFRDPNIELWFATHNIECRRGLDQQNVAIWFVASGTWKCSTGQRILYTGVKRIRVAHEMSCIANFVHCFRSSGFRKSSVWSPSTTKLDANCACKALQWHLVGHCEKPTTTGTTGVIWAMSLECLGGSFCCCTIDFIHGVEKKPEKWSRRIWDRNTGP